MIITDIVALDKKRSKVYLDGAFAFVLYNGELRSYDMICGHELTKEIYQKLLDEVLLKRAKLRAMKLLTARAYTEKKLREKLEEGFYQQELIDCAIDYVKSFGYLDDEAYAADFIAYHAKDFNKQQIEGKLMKRGISKEIIKQQMEKFFEQGNQIEETAQIKKLLEKKDWNPDNMTYEEQQKMKAALCRRGFQLDQILLALNAL